MDIKNKTFVVTGAASGLGKATSAMLVAQGGNVIMADLNEQVGKAREQELGERARFIRTDVTQEADTRAAVDLAISAFGTLHGAINCAGIAPAAKIVGKNGPHTLDDFMKVLNINLIGTFNILRYAAAAMVEHGDKDSDERGVIINTASIAAYEGQIGQIAYAASKGAVVSMTLPAARELARHKIRVLTIAPGLMETPMMLNMPQEVQDSLTVTIPFPPKFGKATDYAKLVRHIIDNPYLNGETIRLDGALRMAGR